jgi:PEP-CTERM motif
MNLIRTLQTVSLAAVSTVAAHAVTLDFTGTTDFTDNFSAPAGSYSRGAAVGVGNPTGGPGVSVFNSNAAYHTGATDAIPALASGNTVSTGIFFKRTTNAFTGTGVRISALGLTTSSAALTSSAGGLGQAIASEGNFGLIIQSAAVTAGGITTMRVRTFDSDNNTTPVIGGTNLGSTFDVTDGNWYKFDVSITKTATADTWAFTATVQDWGSTGTSFVSTLYTLTSTNFTAAGAARAYADGSVFAGFSGASSFGNAVDNFSLTTAIPEPSSFAMIAGLGVIGLAALRRRRSGC